MQSYAVIRSQGPIATMSHGSNTEELNEYIQRKLDNQRACRAAKRNISQNVRT